MDMAIQYEFEAFGQPSLYKNSERRFKVYFSEPESGVDEKTGILLFISGYGANPTSNVYKKMRNGFADKYNLITLQCEYFGIEFMKSEIGIKSNEFTQKELQLINLPAKNGYDYTKRIIKEFDETQDNMNDMGPIQAIDNLTSIASVIEILKNNNLVFNKNKIIIYGYSHGAYLAHLCNIFSPYLISTIIDNSGYIWPEYLKFGRPRVIYGYLGQLRIETKFKYLINDIIFDKELYDLKKLYSQIKNKCRIIAFQGIEDELYDYCEKVNFIQDIDNATVELITSNDVDGFIFKSAEHGLDADFIKLFEYVNNTYELEQKNDSWGFKDVEYKTQNYTYKIKNNLGVPVLSYEKNK